MRPSIPVSQAHVAYRLDDTGQLDPGSTRILQGYQSLHLEVAVVRCWGEAAFGLDDGVAEGEIQTGPDQSTPPNRFVDGP